jgi:hypothetical protein
MGMVSHTIIYQHLSYFAALRRKGSEFWRNRLLVILLAIRKFAVAKDYSYVALTLFTCP